MTEIQLGNIGCEKQAKRIKALLQGKTYYDLKVSYASMVNNWPVSVYTEDEGVSESELTEMVLFVLACEV